MDQSNNETGFAIIRKKGIRGTYSVIGYAGANVTNYADNIVAAPNTYYYAVYAYNGYGNSAYSDEVSASPHPSLPTELKGTSVSAATINLVWKDNSSDETSFEIYRKTGAGAETLLISTAPNITSYSDTSATGNSSTTSYSYSLKVCKNTTCSPKTAVSLIPYSPINLTAAASANEINLMWTDRSTNETGFQVFRKEGACASINAWSLHATKGQNTTTHSNTGLISGSIYSYKIRSYTQSTLTPYSYGYSSWSNCVQATVP